ncbi:hypothetical protein D5E69_23115 (plasmid) [Rossellomorea marisflavi]|uniref:hypothetical protein n=1 Tax=Rossellomorea marisflavi TaxID=189381 RepID=UPI0013196191|nr:hypothetical protein [Rossellomorea marisflavi]QHA38725.1 hypothetical protein D5E69_23115 [Rossellomorea marisflavi]
MKPGVKIVLGISLSVLTMSFVVMYDLYIKERIDSEEVVVVKAGQEIKKNERITRSMIAVERRSKQSIISDAIPASEFGTLLTKTAGQTIVGNSMISKKMIDYDLLIPDPDSGEAIRPITDEMIYSQPGSLRRKDRIDIYLVKKKEESGNVNVASSKDGKKNSNLVQDPILTGIRVVYVKDDSNKEVINGTPDKEKDDRLNASGKISALEVILNEEDFQKLMDKVVNEDYLLYITYN